MRVIGVVSGKGGAGKTTVAVNLAARLGPVGRGDRVMLLDADAQPSASASWYLRDTGGHDGPSGVEVTTYHPPVHLSRTERDESLADLIRRLPALDGVWDWIVIDTIPVLDSAAVTATIDTADFLVLPTRVSAGDMARLVETIRAAVEPAGTRYGVVLSDVDPRVSREASTAADTLASFDVPVLGVIRSYVTVRRAAMRGLVAGQFDGPAAQRALDDFDRVTRAVVDAMEPPAPTVDIADLLDAGVRV